MNAAGLIRLLEAERALEAQATRDPEAKSAIAHLAAWRARLCGTVEALLEGGPAPASVELDSVNAAEHPVHLGMSWAAVTRAWSESFDRLLGLARRLTDRDLERSPGWFRSATLLDAILLNSVSHPALHLVELYSRPPQLEALQRQVDARLRLLRELDAPPASLARAELHVAIHRCLDGRREDGELHLAEALRLQPELIAPARAQPALEGLGLLGGPAA